MIMKLCAKCQRIVQAPNKYCDTCLSIVKNQAEIMKQQSNSRYNKQRDKKYMQFYNSKAWRTLRKRYLNKHYLCEKCQQEARQKEEYDICLAEEVHHKEPIQTEIGWLKRLEWNNLISLCHKHHDMEHERFGKKRQG